MKVRNILIVTIIALFFIECGGQTREARKQQRYTESCNEFDDFLITHFPARILSDSSLTVSKLAPEKNKVQLLLYEFYSHKLTEDSLLGALKKQAVAQYSSKDTCLFIMHRNETPEPFDEEPPEDYSKVHKRCLSKYPIPNFIDLERYIMDSVAFGLDTSFTIYVLESKPGRFSKKFNLSPFKQMPGKWKNGFSRGIAISEQRKTIIYWGGMW